LYKSREEFIRIAQRPEKDILVIGEAVSRNQGWTEGALESVEAIFVSNDIVLK
jgi:monoamine oxidase